MDGLAGLSFGFIVCLLFLSIFAFETDEFPFFLLNLGFALVWLESMYCRYVVS